MSLTMAIDSQSESQETASTSVSEDSANISFENITYTVRHGLLTRGRKTILNDMSGQFNAGELSVIVGQSGAGKSSLMDILAGYIKPTVGKIYVNGVVRDERMFRRRSCYILQDDQVQDKLTVLESLRIAAELKLGNHISGQQKQQRVQEIVTALDLLSVRRTQAANLSGGQRKRLAIGLELVSDPPVMFLDEPISGLDVSISKQLVYLLYLLARQGRTIVITMHQPSAALLTMVDRLYAIVGGKCAYMGSVPLLLPYMQQINLMCQPYHNPVDFLMEICLEHENQLVQLSQNGRNHEWINNICYETDSNLLEKYKLSKYDDVVLTNLPPPNKGPTRKILLALQSTYPTSSWKQFTILMKRSLLTTWRDSSNIRMITGIHLLMAFLVGILFFRIGEDAGMTRQNFNLLYYCLMFQMFTSFTTVSIKFPKQISVVRREHFNRWYSAGAYYSSTLVSAIPSQTLWTLSFGTIIYFMTGQPAEFKRIFLFSCTLLLVSYVSLCIGLLNGSIFNVKNGVIFGPFFLMPFTVFSGFFLTYKDANHFIQWIFHMSFLKHGLAGMVISIFDLDRAKFNCADLFCYYSYPKQLLIDIGMNSEKYVVVVFALLVIACVVILSSFIILKIRLKTKW